MLGALHARVLELNFDDLSYSTYINSIFLNIFVSDM